MNFSKILKSFFSNPVFFLLLGILAVLTFLDGGTNVAAEILILVLPLPLFLLGLISGEVQFSKLSNWIIFSWLVFLFFTAVSIVGSVSQIFSIPAFFQLLAAFLFFNLFLSITGKESIKYSVGLIFVVALLLCFLGFYYLLPKTGMPAAMNLVYATYGHSHLADYLLLVIPFALVLFLTAKEKKQKLLLGGLLAFYFLSFVLTFSRGAFLVLPPVVLLLIFLLKPRTATKKAVGWLFILVPLGLLLLILAFSLSSFGLEIRLAHPRQWLVKQMVKPEFQAKRLDYWQQALRGFGARPLTGFGWGAFELVGFRFQQTPAGWSNFAHNFYLQVLAEAGIFAFLSFLGFLFLSFRYIWQLVKKNRKNPFLLGSFGAILASCLHSFLDYDWHFPAVFLTFLFLLASLLSLKKRKVGSQKWNKIYQWGLILLSLLVFVFGWTRMAGEYYFKRGDYQKALLFSPWPAGRARQFGDMVFEDNFVQGERIGQNLISLSSQDPLMHYWLAEKYFSKGNLKKTAEHYQKAIEYNPLGNYRLYQKLGGIYSQLGEMEKADELYQSFARKLEETKAFQKENPTLAKSFYLIGEEYLNQGKEEEVVFWWRKAVEASPEWSYFHIELASLFINLGELDQAREVLNNCLDFYFPKEHCQKYQDRLSKGIDFESPGFWRLKILAI